MTPKNKQNDSETDNDLKQLKYHATITAFSMGNYKIIFDFTTCIDICNKRDQYYNRDTESSYYNPPKYYILSAAKTKIETFQTYLRNLKRPEAYFLVMSLNNMVMDIQDLFLSIFRRMEGIIDLSYEFNDIIFSNRIKDLGLPSEMENDLEKLTTLRNKLIHVYGYAKPKTKGKPDQKLNKLIKERIGDIYFNSDPQKKLIAENIYEDMGNHENIGKWVTLIEILLDIISNINKTKKNDNPFFLQRKTILKKFSDNLKKDEEEK